MASLSTLRTAMRRLLDETDSSNSNFSDSELNDYLNQSLRKTATEFEWPITTATATSVTQQANYSLPTNFLSLLTVFFDSKKIDLSDLEDMASKHPDYKSADPGEPSEVYRADNNQIGLYPKPSSTYAGKTILVEYIKFPDDLSLDADTPDLLSVIADILPFYACMIANLRAGNLKTASYFEGLYGRELKSLKPKVEKFSEELMAMRWV